MEGSFGDAALRHGFKRSRWRRLWRQQIQDYLIAAVQNLRLLARKVHSKEDAMAYCALYMDNPILVYAILVLRKQVQWSIKVITLRKLQYPT